ncbi:NAD(P)H-hydrate dehydratase [Faecalibacterium sp. An58]|uniref:NAD(P)H-hydrate dehydratase n=1 Tax=Faecalibacterium sp. An58 TaxID=1965648 RepID=UPI000B388D2D|nr:NAD(P)H-hydrate dehydratase [Faecalibacterium sp. An58]OUN75716.1 NAD(P)H-hydrate dehydratase [Faecalibacterium sp. An58]
MEQLNKEFVFSHIPPRAAESHKGSYGRLLVVAGSRRYRGAAGLAAEGALRSGAGIVTLASVEPVIGAAASRLPECCLLPCPEGEEGGIAAAGLEMLQAAAAHATVLLLGPGLGYTGDTRALVQGLPAQMRGTVVLDADGLNAAADLLARGGAMPLPASGSLIVTPHPGEMARLTGLPAERIAADRPGVASRFAAQWGCTVVLKGHRTLIAAPDGRLWQNTTGNPGLARGGSGDVLAGMIAGLAACGLDAPAAAACGVWLHGAAADRTAARLGQYGMLPHDILADLGGLFAENGR